MKIIGIVLETREDALACGKPNLDAIYHWREPEEIQALRHAIKAAGYESVLLGPPKEVCRDLSKLRGMDFILNLSVGFVSRSRLAEGPALYELCGIPYSGADPYAKIMSQHKPLMKSLWDKMGIPTPEWAYLHEKEDLGRVHIPGAPLIVKPAYEGSSIGINPSSVVRNMTDLKSQVDRIFCSLKTPVLIERFIEGHEYHVGIIGNSDIEFIGMIEDLKLDGSPLDAEFSYFEAKKVGRYRKVARDINNPLFQELLEDVRKAYRLFSPIDYGVMDIRMDSQGNHYFLELNADATLHPQRTLAKCCELNGVPYVDMIRKILTCSFRRWGILDPESVFTGKSKSS